MTNLILSISDFFRKGFTPIDTNFNWDFFFGLLGTYLGVLGLISKKAKKGFELRQGDTFYKTKVPDNLGDKLSINYKGKPVESIISTVLFLENTGNVELKRDDFNNDCILEFSDNIELLEYSIDSSDKFTVIKSNFADNKLHLSIVFIEPKTYIRIELLYKCEKLPDTKMSANIVSGDKKVYDLKDYNRIEHEVGKSKDSSFLPMWTGICIGILIGIAFLFAKMFNVQIWDADMNVMIPWGWAALFCIAAFIPAFIIWHKVFRQLTFVARNWFDTKEWTRIEHHEIA